MPEIKTNQEFVTEVLKVALDFNSQIISVATVEIAGEQSGRNRTHQRKVLTDLQMLGHTYSRNLEQMYQTRENELRDEGVKVEFDDSTRSAILKTISVLDAKMQKAPSPEIADTSNYLEMMLKSDDLPKEEEGALKS